ncbi:hypothetical protein SERLADRAFT_354961 [Serpula lacrymans var. lacrymans S7.9]|uniref:TRUD domain-containing protein n=1 Tax=Serpula lacrymans var. lacrymans (strain S7.9) TaxID=578457 RepID=F8NM26_SERL9|nr:uncharacterized protein SERLADRAFT_354961 [Serpula lacrymans var. lacrymans S7.9]EGO27814.1 hypothetical protein SERLADRAFT_354961 [Serpula lacrymans var. lacrymans S7.9]
METDVGISEYVGRDVPPINGIIKQRFTDFLVYEVDLDYKVVHIKSLEMAESSQKKNEPAVQEAAGTGSTKDEEQITVEGVEASKSDEPGQVNKEKRHGGLLAPYMSEDAIIQLKQMYLEGPEPPRTTSKETRTALHKVVRDLFGGKLESETDTTSPASDDGSRIVIKWSKRGGGRGGRGERVPRGTYPPYIHFTLQKTNRDTQDALAHLSRTLRVNLKDLAVAGTKDKRGVTVQRVSLRRGNKTVEDSMQDILTQRGERGVRIADLNYRKASLDLGMLKGNAFLITLRNVQVDSVETLDRSLSIMKYKGFINYYGMQRFGTAAVPTHSIGLAFLKSDWHKAVALILQKRPGEHPDVVAAREAWLIDGDLERALDLMPRRVVAERCILESYQKQKGETRNAMGALSTIPRNLRLMYIHAYQSYVWNAIVSERIRRHGSDKPVPGDLVFEKDTNSKVGDGGDMDVDGPDGEPGTDEKPLEEAENTVTRSRKKPWVAPRVKTLTEEDADQYSIFDVIMPLPGKDVAYPGGELGEQYREFLRRDGLDPDNYVRKQKEYILGGSYRKILLLPKDVSWSVLRYTDPDVALAQADEDKLLGFDPPVVVEDGKFMALQINLTLETAAYATMALREVTKTETSSHFQTGLTQASEDQKFRGTADTEVEAEGVS